MKVEIEFKVKKLMFFNSENCYTKARIHIIEQQPKNAAIAMSEAVISGACPQMHKDDNYRAIGEWVDTGSEGWQFLIDNAELIFPETQKGIIKFLRKYAMGVQEKDINKIVQVFKEDTLQTIQNNPQELKKIKISELIIQRLRGVLNDYRDFERILYFLLGLDVPYVKCIEIFSIYGGMSDTHIRDNPYSLIDILSFKKCDDIANRFSLRADNPVRIEVAIREFIEKQMKDRGDLFTYKTIIINDLNSYLKIYGAFDDEVTIYSINLAINNLSTKQKIAIELNNNGEEVIYLSYYNYVENQIVKYINNMADIKVKKANEEIIDVFTNEYESEREIELGNKQRDAIHMVINNRLSILTGGPGTGKTEVINAIINCINRIDSTMSIQLCAPTGRAAKRMTELTGKEAKTIHRLIGLNNLENNPSNLIPIDSDYLIIDEASMIDAHVFYNLLSVISVNTKVLIVGDHNQLPSVGPGLILRDLINSNRIPTTILTEIFRQAKDSQIVVNAHKIIKGQKDIKLDQSKKDFSFIEESKVNDIKKHIVSFIKDLLDDGYKIDEIQILSPMKNGDLGVNELNKMIQDKFNPSARNKFEYEISLQRVLRVGDRVIQTENNYDIEVFNGEVGKITSITDSYLSVDYGDKEVLYGKEIIAQLTLAYAITVHKSQGSEFKNVIIPIHRSLNYMLNRNIIYTAITRAKEKIVLIGEKEELEIGISKTDNTIRNSQIKDKLNNEDVVLPF